jgi:hypothetical protein
MKLVPSGHRRQLREQQRRQPVEGPAEEEEEGVFGRASDRERGSRAGGTAGCAASTCCQLRIFNLFVIKQRCL